MQGVHFTTSMDYDPADLHENDEEFMLVCDNPDCIIMGEHRRSECYTAVEAELMASQPPAIYRARPKRRTWWERLSDAWHNWPYYYRRYLGWLPVQCCIRCGNPFWGGLPRPGWRAWFQEYCSSTCHAADNPPDRSAD